MGVEAAPVCYRHTDRESHIRCQRCERPICPDCMKSAAVGFHCPECVREGQRSVRQGRPLSFAARGVPVVTYVLIGINVAVWAAVLAVPSLLDFLMLHKNNLCSAGPGIYTIEEVNRAQCFSGLVTPGNVGVHFSPGVDHGAWYQVITSMFTHERVWHIASNMLSLWMIGPLLEAVLGRVRYLAVYLVSGLAGSALVLAATPHFGSTLGASGAIFGLLGALVVVFLRRGLPLQQLGTVVALNFFITFTVPNISWEAHVGGFLAGLALGAAYAYTPLGRRT